MLYIACMIPSDLQPFHPAQLEAIPLCLYERITWSCKRPDGRRAVRHFWVELRRDDAQKGVPEIVREGIAFAQRHQGADLALGGAGQLYYSPSQHQRLSWRQQGAIIDAVASGRLVVPASPVTV